MFSVAFLNELRAFEFDYYLRHLEPGVRILEIGGGTGIQARMLAEHGFAVESIDVEHSEYRDDKVYDVTLFDGHLIPFPDASFDVVFSSNVLEHIRHIDAFEEEIKRVLKPGGYCIHSMPSGLWTFWTTITHYINAAQQVAGSASSSQPAAADPVAPPRGRLGRRVRALARCAREALAATVRRRGRILPQRHGEFGTVLHELFTFSRFAWKRHFRRAGYEVVLARPMGLFYTGYMIFGPKWPLRSRQRWSAVLGSAANFYLVRVPGPAPRAAIPPRRG